MQYDNLSDDSRSFLKDLLKSQGWKLFKQVNLDKANEYRKLATQPPGAIPEEKRVWYSAQAHTIEESIGNLEESVL